MKYRIKQLSALLYLLFMMAISCDQEPDVKRDFDYKIKMEKYRNEIAGGETKEFTFIIVREGEYKDAEYVLSYFLRQGNGTLSDAEGKALKENTDYRAEPSGFRLFYTAHTKETHKIELLFKDSFGKEKELIIDLSGKD